MSVIDHSFGSRLSNSVGPRSCYGFLTIPLPIEAECLPSQSSILWLDVCEDPTLSRLCVAPKEIFSLPLEQEDDRLANGMRCCCC